MSNTMFLSRSHFAAKALSLALPLMASLSFAQQAPTATLRIQTDKPIAKVSPTLYGLITEEIN